MDEFEDLKTLISSILISSPLTMTVGNLNRDFMDQVGYHIPFKKFGFGSLDQCLQAMKDTLHLRGTGMQAEVIVHVHSKSAHIDKLISKQKTKPQKRKNFGHHPKVNFRQSKAIPLTTNTHSDNVHAYKQNMMAISSPDQTSLPYPQYYIPPALRSSRYNNAFLKTEQPQDLFRSENRSSIPPLMVKTVTPPKNFVQSRTISNSQHTMKQNIPNQHIEPVSDLSTNKCNLAQNSTNYAEFTLPVDKYINYATNSINDYTHLGAIPKEPPVYSNEIYQEAPEDDNAEVYSSDEEEPLNIRVPLKVQQNLQTLIDNYEEGIWCSKIPQVYEQMFNKELDYEEYGYKSLIQMCVDLKAIFFWYRPDKGDFKLYDRSKPPPKDLDKHFKQSDFINMWSYVSSQPSNEPALVDVEELVGVEPEDCYPPDVVHLLEELPRQFIPEDQEDEYIDVTVGEVYDPSKFWLMLKDFSPQLDQLMDDMQPFYLSHPELKIPAHMVKEGLYCTTIYNREYHRAIIVNLMPLQKDKVKVFYIDYGTVSSTLISNLHFLHRDFFKLPQQAIRARLANIYPPTTNTTWSSESSSRFLDLVKMKNLIAHLYRIDYNQQILEVFLVDTTGEVDLYMNDTLVQEGYAIFTNEEQEQLQFNPRVIPKVDCLHLIPTFDEMEQGLVPNASEMIRLQKVGVSIEQILSQYFIHDNLDTQSQNRETLKTKQLQPEKSNKEKRSTVAVRRSQLDILNENRLIHESEHSDDALDLEVPDTLNVRNLPEPEVIIAKPSIRPPPGFETIQEQKIKITTSKVNGENVLNTVVTQTNIEARNTENILNYLLCNVNALPNQHQTVPNATTSGLMQSYQSAHLLDQLALLRNQIAMNNAGQQTHMLGNQNVYAHQQMLTPSYANHNLFNATVPNQLGYFTHANIINGTHLPYSNPVLSPLRLHMQESIKELMLSENKVILSRFLFIVKKRLLVPGPHHGLLNLMPDIINKTIIYPLNTLSDIYKHAMSFLSDEDIIDLANEAKACILLMQSNCAATQTQFLQPVAEIESNVRKLCLSDAGTNTNVTNSTTLRAEETNTENKNLVYELDFHDSKLHIIYLGNEAHAMVTEVLQLVNKKMPIERVRKCIVMTDPSISVLDIHLQNEKNIVEQLSRYMHVDSRQILHIVPIKLVPKLINIIDNRKDLSSKFNDFLNLPCNKNLIS